MEFLKTPRVAVYAHRADYLNYEVAGWNPKREFGLIEFFYFTANIIFKFIRETQPGNLVTGEMRPQIEGRL
jgi:hypothetical protein